MSIQVSGNLQAVEVQDVLGEVGFNFGLRLLVSSNLRFFFFGLSVGLFLLQRCLYRGFLDFCRCNNGGDNGALWALWGLLSRLLRLWLCLKLSLKVDLK